MMMETIVHQAVHNSQWLDSPLKLENGWEIPAKGCSNIVRMLYEGARFRQMVNTPDAVAFAFGIERDDD